MHTISFYSRRIYLLVLFALLATIQGTVNGQEITTYEQGKLSINDGIPVLTVKGTHYQMGIQYGTLLNEQLVEMDSTVDSLIAENIGGFFLKQWIGKAVLKRRIKEVDKRMPDYFIRELEGMAEASDLSLTDIKTIAYFPQVFFEISCTSFIMKDQSAILHGRNLDWNGIDPLVRFPLIVNYHPNNGNAFTVATFIGYPGVYTGMNHKGLSISINMNGASLPKAMDAEGFRQCMPSAYKTRQILEQAVSLHQVDSLLANYRIHGWFFTVGSLADNSGYVYELTRGKIFKNKMKEDFLVVENLALSEDTRKALTPIWEHSSSNTSREAKIHELYKNISEKDLTEKAYMMLSDVSFYDEENHPTYFYGINNGSTVQSCILDLVNQRFYFAYAPGLAGHSRYYRYDIATEKFDIYKQPTNQHTKALGGFKSLRNALYQNAVASKKHDDAYYQRALSIIDESDAPKGVKFYYRAIYLNNKTDYEASIDEWRSLTKLHPAYEYARYQLARLLRKENRLNEADEALRELENLSTLSEYYQYRGQIERILLTLQQYKEGSATFEQVRAQRQKVNDLLKGYFIDSGTQLLLQKLDKKIEEANDEYIDG
jgi:hypothetical protein